ncbi:MAG: ATP-binding protein [Hyphomicrobiaceae bacterium]
MALWLRWGPKRPPKLLTLTILVAGCKFSWLVNLLATHSSAASVSIRISATHVHITTESGLARIYGRNDDGHVVIGHLSSAESIPAKIALNELVTRHSAVLGSTGSGKSTTIASLMRSITTPAAGSAGYPSARVLMLDVHGEYSNALGDVATIFSVDPRAGEHKLEIPYWALDTIDLLDFLTGGVDGNRETAFTDKIFNLKVASHNNVNFPESSQVQSPWIRRCPSA